MCSTSCRCDWRGIPWTGIIDVGYCAYNREEIPSFPSWGYERGDCLPSHCTADNLSGGFQGNITDQCAKRMLQQTCLWSESTNVAFFIILSWQLLPVMDAPHQWRLVQLTSGSKERLWHSHSHASLFKNKYDTNTVAKYMCQTLQPLWFLNFFLQFNYNICQPSLNQQNVILA